MIHGNGNYRRDTHAHPVDLDAQFVDQTRACMPMVSVTAFTHGPWASLPLLVS